MKKILVCAWALLFAGSLGAQTNVPTAVSAAFQKKFPAAKSVRWEQEEPGQYEACFRWNHRKMSALFHENGEWQETETPLKVSRLPQAVRDAAAQAFAGFEIDEAEQVETSAGIAYELELEKEEGKQEKEVEALFSADGKLLKQTTESETDDD